MKYAIDPDISIAEVQEKYPYVVDFLIEEYGFYCATCFFSQFETLRQGAEVHSITGKYFEEMMEEISELVNKTNQIANNDQSTTDSSTPPSTAKLAG